MTNFILQHYLAFKGIHIIAIICWMAGLLYLPRIFVYQTGAVLGGELDSKLKIMGYRLYYYIMHPSMMFVYLSGGMMLLAKGLDNIGAWFHIKIVLIVLLTIVHFILGKHLYAFAVGANKNSSFYFRWLNELPTVIMIAIVMLAVTKPF